MERVYKAINPYELEELVYLCPSCLNKNFPKTEGMTKSAAKKVDTSKPSGGSKQTTKSHQTASTAKTKTVNVTANATNHNDDEHEEIIHCSQIQSSSASTNIPFIPRSPTLPLTTQKQKSMPQGEHNSNTGDQTQVQNQNKSPNDTPADKNIQICKEYRLGKCIHGISGNKDGRCSYKHPKLCQKLMRHGTRKQLGCNLGKKCSFFHPKICSSSLTKRQCLDLSCPDWHIKGTSRTDQKLRHPNNTHLQHQVEHQSPQDDTFLGAVHCLQQNQKSVELQVAQIFQMLTRLQLTNQRTQQQMLPSHNQQQEIHPPENNTYHLGTRTAPATPAQQIHPTNNQQQQLQQPTQTNTMHHQPMQVNTAIPAQQWQLPQIPHAYLPHTSAMQTFMV